MSFSLIRIVLYLSVCIWAAKAEVSLPPLPYDKAALEPYISAKTLEFHHGKHHAKYVATTNSLIAGTPYESMPLEKIFVNAHNSDQGVFNNAAQSWNHAFYWKCMKPNGGGLPSGILLEKINASYGSFEEFSKEFKNAGNTAFGSGWAWLCYRKQDGRLLLQKTFGAGNPMTTPGLVPLLTMDVWEHAYYLDYQNLRPKYTDTFMQKLVNWEFVAENLQSAMNEGPQSEL